MSDHNITRITNTTDETVVSADRCRLIAIVPEATTLGTVTIRDAATAGGSNVKHICAIGLTQVGKSFSQRGVRFASGLTVQLSDNTDDVAVIWAPKFS
jgi:hypothetical protein